MNLTTAQLSTLKANILADGVLSLIPRTADGFAAIADAYNVVDATFFVYRTNVPTQEIYNQITWANLTPADAPDGTQLWLNRAMQCQGKQFNVQILLQGVSALNAANSKVRAGLQDALTNVPSGVAGAAVSAGWVSVRDNALTRKATRGEKLFTDTTGGNGSTAVLAATMVAEGAMTGQNIEAAFNA